ncbi:MAG: FtsK/SpoIIIE domain-containing protein [Actinomycetota bacterium]|nr:FtsK/SpoIIIE domain-containing protein [Actinomycetota bacterium]
MTLADYTGEGVRDPVGALSSGHGWAYLWDSAGWGEPLPDQDHVFATREILKVAGVDQFDTNDGMPVTVELRRVAESMLIASGGRGRGAALEFRYLAEPRQGAPNRVRLFVTFKAFGRPDSRAGQVVQEAVEAICDHLPKGYEWGPPEAVSFPAEGALFEVRKQEEVIKPTLLDVPTGYFYVPHSIGGDARGWPQLGRALAEATEPVVVSLLFTPTLLDPAEQQAMNTILSLLEYYGRPRQEPDVRGMMEQIPPDAGAAAALAVWGTLQTSLRHCFLGRAAVFGPYDTALAVAKAVSSSASLGPEDRGAVAPMVQRAREVNLPLASHSFGFLDVVPWGGHPIWEDEDAPQLLRRMPYLYSISEASALAVLPVPDEQGAPGFPRARRAVGRRVGRVPQGDDGVMIGYLQHEGAAGGPAMLPLSAINRHVLVVGAPGSGKTMTVLSLLTNLWRDHRVPFLAIEPSKTEYRSLLGVRGLEDLKVITLGRDDIAPLRLNPLAPPPGVRCETHMSAVMAALRATLPLDPPLPQLLEGALEASYERAGWDYDTTSDQGITPPTLRDLLECYELGFDKLEYKGEVRATLLAAVKVRLGSLLKGARGLLLDTVESVDIASLLNQPVVVEIDEIADSEDKAILAAFLLDRIRAAARARGSGSKLRHVTVLEEAHRLLSKVGAQDGDSPRGAAIRAFCEAIAELRALGEGFIISSQSPAALADAAVANAGTKILHRLESAADRDVVLADVDANDDERKAAARLAQGEAVIKWPQLDELEFVKILAPEGVDSGRPVTNEEVRARMAEMSTAVRSLIPYRLCTREVCRGGCNPQRRADGARIARELGDDARQVWNASKPRTVDALGPIATTLVRASRGDAPGAYCGAVHLAIRGDAFVVPVKGSDIRSRLASGIRDAARRVDGNS